MNPSLHNFIAFDSRISIRQPGEGLRQSLNSNCGRIFENARNLWERKFAGKEPSDACVRVRISGTRAAFENFQTSSPQPYTSLTA